MHRLTLLLCTTFISCAGIDKMDRRLQSPNFKNGAFQNTEKYKDHTFFDFLKMRISTTYAKWPTWVETARDESPAQKIEGEKIRVTFINHATFLIQTGGYNILTDPVFSKRVSPLTWAGPKRIHNPGIALDKLPKIDVIIISHDHYDHLDLASLNKLIARDKPKIFTGLGVASRLEHQDLTTEFDWWEGTQVAPDFKITFAEVQHFSGRTLTDRNSTLWGGFVLEIGTKKIYFGGDSGYAGHYKKTYEKFGAMDLALIPIGAYAPREFMRLAHVDPKQAVQAHIDLHAKKSIGIHFGCFQLSAESRLEPEELLQKEREIAKLKPDEFFSLEVGKPRDF